MKAVRNDENRTKIEQIEEILGLGDKTVIGKINAKIAELEKEFNDSIESDYYELIDLTGLDAEDLYFKKDPDRTELFEAFKDNVYSVEYYEVETFMEVLDRYYKDRWHYLKLIRELKELLD